MRPSARCGGLGMVVSNQLSEPKAARTDLSKLNPSLGDLASRIGTVGTSFSARGFSWSQRFLRGGCKGGPAEGGTPTTGPPFCVKLPSGLPPVRLFSARPNWR